MRARVQRRAGLTLDGVQGGLFVVRLEVAQLLADDKGQLDLKVEIDALGPDDGTGPRGHNGGGGLQKEEGLLGPRAVQLRDVITALIMSARGVFLPMMRQLRGIAARFLRIVAANADDLAGLL